MQRELPISIYIGIALILTLGTVSIYQELLGPTQVTVHILDVGEKGRAVLILTPLRHAVLVNVGADAHILRALGVTLPIWKRHLDAVIITRPKTDSVGGLPIVTERYRVKRLFRPEEAGSKSIEATIARISQGISVTRISSTARFSSPDGVVITLSEQQGLEIVFRKSHLELASTSAPTTYLSDGEKWIRK